MAPALSVIIPTRDRATTIAETLTALASQPEVELVEVIVVDDGSEDDTFAVLERAASTLPLDLHPIRRPRAGGPGAARNSGIEHASLRCCCSSATTCVPRRRCSACTSPFTAKSPALERH